jgi:hypothetical protein
MCTQNPHLGGLKAAATSSPLAGSCLLYSHGRLSPMSRFAAAANRDPDSRSRPNRETGDFPIPVQVLVPASRESEVPSPFPGQIGNRGGRELGISGSVGGPGPRSKVVTDLSLRLPLKAQISLRSGNRLFRRPPGLGGLKKRKFNLNFNVDRQHQCPAASRPGKSDLRNHQAIVQPRLYDCLMVTQITLNTEPHGFDSCQGHSLRKSFVVLGQVCVVDHCSVWQLHSPLSRAVAFAHGSLLE